MPATDSDFAMQLDLLGWRPRGGARLGAGRKRTSARMPHLSRAPSRNAVFHITARVAPGLPSLRTARVVARIETNFRRGCERADFRLVHYSLQRNHLHLIVEAAESRALGRGVRALLIRVARAANAAWRRYGPVIADRFHHRRLATPREVRNAICYVLHNARKHLGGPHSDNRIDPASSGRWFWKRATDRPTVALPSFWLLRAGWLRHGPIPV
jgi:REP element-mobilizing transposase RayT